jgi:hypothetical protein
MAGWLRVARSSMPLSAARMLALPCPALQPSHSRSLEALKHLEGGNLLKPLLQEISVGRARATLLPGAHNMLTRRLTKF